MNEQQIHSVLATCRGKATELGDAEDDQTEKNDQKKQTCQVHPRDLADFFLDLNDQVLVTI